MLPRGTSRKKETEIDMARMTDNEIFERLQSTAGDYGIRLTYTHKLFYVRLLAYASEHGEVCPEGLKVSLSVNEMSTCLSITKRMVEQSLRAFSDSGILLRNIKKSFPRSCDTVLKKEFYERSREHD